MTLKPIGPDMKRGRASSNELAAIPFQPHQRWISSPNYLNRQEKELFDEVVHSCPPSQFAPCDTHILVSFVQSTLMARRAMAKLTKKSDPTTLAVWDRAVKTQAALATKLRLAPNSRSDMKVVARRIAAHRPSAYE
jgi:hypothetical protein